LWPNPSMERVRKERRTALDFINLNFKGLKIINSI
jgi:hypothetical protein